MIELASLYIINKHISLHKSSYYIAATKQEAVTNSYCWYKNSRNYPNQHNIELGIILKRIKTIIINYSHNNLIPRNTSCWIVLQAKILQIQDGKSSAYRHTIHSPSYHFHLLISIQIYVTEHTLNISAWNILQEKIWWIQNRWGMEKLHQGISTFTTHVPKYWMTTTTTQNIDQTIK